MVNQGPYKRTQIAALSSCTPALSYCGAPGYKRRRAPESVPRCSNVKDTVEECRGTKIPQIPLVPQRSSTVAHHGIRARGMPRRHNLLVQLPVQLELHHNLSPFIPSRLMRHSVFWYDCYIQ